MDGTIFRHHLVQYRTQPASKMMTNSAPARFLTPLLKLHSAFGGGEKARRGAEPRWHACALSCGTRFNAATTVRRDGAEPRAMGDAGDASPTRSLQPIGRGVQESVRNGVRLASTWGALGP